MNFGHAAAQPGRQRSRVWSLNFMLESPNALPEAHFNAKVYPQVFAWIDRFRVALQAARTKNGPRMLPGEVAAAEIIHAAWHEGEGARLRGGEYRA